MTPQVQDKNEIQDQLTENVQNLLRTAQTISKKCQTPEWRNNLPTNQLDATRLFADEIMTYFNKHKSGIGIGSPELVESS